MWQKQLSNLKTKSVRKPRSVRKKSKSVGRGRSGGRLCSFKRGGSKSRLNVQNYCIENNIKKLVAQQLLQEAEPLQKEGRQLRNSSNFSRRRGIEENACGATR